MVNGSKPGFVISTRQKADTLFGPLSKPLGAGESVVLPARRVAGYARVNFLGISVLAFTILVEEANAGGFFTQTALFTSALDVSTGLQAICDRIVPCGTYMRVTVTNTGPSPASISFLANGLPHASSGSGSGNGATGPQGATGIQGVTGPGGGSAGATGVQGVTGAQGQTGLQGTTGVQGVTGLQGATGIQGVTGLQGQTGLQGVTGTGSGGALQWLQTITLGADAQDIPINTLDGDVDMEYLIEVSFMKGAAGLVTYTLRPNNLTTNLTSVYNLIGSGVTNQATWQIHNSGSAIGTTLGITIWVKAKTGFQRQMNPMENIEFGAGATFLAIGAGTWDETLTNITSLVLHASVAAGFKAGTIVRVFRLVDVP